MFKPLSGEDVGQAWLLTFSPRLSEEEELLLLIHLKQGSKRASRGLQPLFFVRGRYRGGR